MYAASSVLSALPSATHRIADYEQAFNARRRELRHDVRSLSLARWLCVRIAALIASRPVAAAPVVATLAQPSMSWVDGPRSQPRDGRGRFLPRTWLADAELFLPADRAWFRSAISTEGK